MVDCLRTHANKHTSRRSLHCCDFLGEFISLILSLWARVSVRVRVGVRVRVRVKVRVMVRVRVMLRVMVWLLD